VIAIERSCDTADQRIGARSRPTAARCGTSEWCLVLRFSCHPVQSSGLSAPWYARPFQASQRRRRRWRQATWFPDPGAFERSRSHGRRLRVLRIEAPSSTRLRSRCKRS